MYCFVLPIVLIISYNMLQINRLKSKEFVQSPLIYVKFVLLKVKLIIFFKDMVNINSRKNIWCHFIPETGPFRGMWVKVVQEQLILLIFTSPYIIEVHGTNWKYIWNVRQVCLSYHFSSHLYAFVSLRFKGSYDRYLLLLARLVYIGPSLKMDF